MPHRTKFARRDDRLAIAHMLVEVAKSYHSIIYPEGNFAANIDGVFISACVFIGDAEHKPMSATKIAHYLGMPRTTVLRKLKDLEARDVIRRHGNVYLISPSRSDKPPVQSKVEKAVRRAAAALSKMDTD